MARLKPKPKESSKIKAGLIRKYRRQKKTIMEIGKILKMTKQGVWWYIHKYRIDEAMK